MTLNLKLVWGRTDSIIMCSLPTQELSISLHEFRLSLKQFFSFPHNLIYLDQVKHTH